MLSIDQIDGIAGHFLTSQQLLSVWADRHRLWLFMLGINAFSAIISGGLER